MSFTHEGVDYFAYKVRYVTTEGKRRQVTVYAPGAPWVSEAVARRLEGVAVRPGSTVRVSPA